MKGRKMKMKGFQGRRGMVEAMGEGDVWKNRERYVRAEEKGKRFLVTFAYPWSVRDLYYHYAFISIFLFFFLYLVG